MVIVFRLKKKDFQEYLFLAVGNIRNPPGITANATEKFACSLVYQMDIIDRRSF